MQISNFDYVSQPGSRQQNDAYGEFNATELYCPHCKQAMPVRQHLLLVLPDGDKYEYRCARCGTSLGDKLDRTGGVYGPALK
ncbi:MAG TPA: cytoplasmic protein [Desulfobacteraceae bacterium]|nr:cytoplasmic protein [Desulfobacteraceae bacterium]